MKPEWIERIRAARRGVARALIAELGSAGHWTGELSSSALSTATAVTALTVMGSRSDDGLIRASLTWLARNANADGGWGDTIRSGSNLSTTALVWAAFGATKADAEFREPVTAAEAYLVRNAGGLDQVVPAIEARYGKDRTFSVPISMMLALSGRLGPDGWQRVRGLPFELAALPRGLFGALRLPVVSYALPALIAIGQVIHHRAGRWNPIRTAVRRRTLETLISLQPPNGGFLEATPLTSFVTMSLAGMGESEHIVARRGAEFLRHSVRPDGSWPIDTNLATWVTTLAVKALRSHPGELTLAQKSELRVWILRQQYRSRHPYTGAAAGGWAWTDLPGGVPDADDTAGALLALRDLHGREGQPDAALRSAVVSGVEWLLGLQNRDGGIPTFCRGWGALPFDQSTPELTAHTLRAWSAWLPELPPDQAKRVRKAVLRALAYLERCQGPDGAWIPLWFGNEFEPGQENPVYGTAQVLIALYEIRDAGFAIRADSESRARDWLRRAQHAGGGWGGAAGLPPSVEETALALRALNHVPDAGTNVDQGTEWLLERVSDPQDLSPAPIGLYFAKLWYFERLYPLIFATDALGAIDPEKQ